MYVQLLISTQYPQYMNKFIMAYFLSVPPDNSGLIYNICLSLPNYRRRCISHMYVYYRRLIYPTACKCKYSTKILEELYWPHIQIKIPRGLRYSTRNQQMKQDSNWRGILFCFHGPCDVWQAFFLTSAMREQDLAWCYTGVYCISIKVCERRSRCMCL